MRKFLIKTTLLSLLILLVVAGVNFVVDPVSLFSNHSLESDVAQMLVREQSVANLTNFDERLLQKHWINDLQKSPNTIVLGSSRALQINRKNSGDSTLINHSVSGARFEDFMAIFECYLERGWCPKQVVVELSPYMFFQGYTDTRFESLKLQYEQMAVRIGVAEDAATWSINPKWSNLVSLSYFQSSIKAIGVPQDSIFTTTDSVLKTQSVKYCDGSSAYPLEYQNRAVTQKDIDDAANYGGVSNFRTIAVERVRVFELFMDYLHKQGVRLELFLAPTPEPIYKKRPIYTAVEQYAVGFAKQNKLSLYGSYDPESLGLALADFYDGLHPKQEVIDFILGKVL